MKISRINLIDKTYLKMAKDMSMLSYAKRKKVGAIAVKNRQIIGEAYNGTPSGWNNMCELPDNTTKPEVLHAESNLIAKLAKSTISSEGCTVYVTLSPCFECAKLLYQAGIKRVIYTEEYRDLSGLEFLKKCDIDIKQIK